MKAILVKRMGKAKAFGKLPKPEVEKFRRERINNSLEKLRVMLQHCPEHQGLAGRRVEKAEILEHAVAFLKCHDGERGKGDAEQQFQDGYTACLRKAADFLRNCSQTGEQARAETRRIAPAVQLFTHLQKLTATPPKNPTPNLPEREATPGLNHSGTTGPTALRRQTLSGLPKVSPRVHSARTVSPSLIIPGQALWRPWP